MTLDEAVDILNRAGQDVRLFHRSGRAVRAVSSGYTSGRPRSFAFYNFASFATRDSNATPQNFTESLNGLHLPLPEGRRTRRYTTTSRTNLAPVRTLQSSFNVRSLHSYGQPIIQFHRTGLASLFDMTDLHNPGAFLLDLYAMYVQSYERDGRLNSRFNPDTYHALDLPSTNGIIDANATWSAPVVDHASAPTPHRNPQDPNRPASAPPGFFWSTKDTTSRLRTPLTQDQLKTQITSTNRNSLRARRESLKIEVTENESKLERKRLEFINALQELGRTTEQLELTELAIKQPENTRDAEAMMVSLRGRYNSIYLQEGVYYAKTDPITMAYDSNGITYAQNTGISTTPYHTGKFIVTVDFNDKKVTYDREDGRRLQVTEYGTYYVAPHAKTESVTGGVRICWGQATSVQLATLIARQDLVSILHLVYSHLSTPNAGDAYIRLHTYGEGLALAQADHNPHLGQTGTIPTETPDFLAEPVPAPTAPVTPTVVTEPPPVQPIRVTPIIIPTVVPEPTPPQTPPASQPEQRTPRRGVFRVVEMDASPNTQEPPRRAAEDDGRPRVTVVSVTPTN